MSPATLRLVLARIRADWVVTAAAALVILVATTLLSSGLIYADAVTLQGLRRALADAPTRQTNIQVSTRLAPAQAATADGAIRKEMASTLPVPARIARISESDSFALPQQPEDGVHNLAIFGDYQEVEAHASIVEGAWPRARTTAGAPLEVAIPGRLARDLGVAVGHSMTLLSRLNPSLSVAVRVTGIYRINDPADPYWWSEPMALDGATESTNYTTYGPLMMADADFGAVITADTAETDWRIFPDLSGVDLDGLSPLRGGVARLDGTLASAVGAVLATTPNLTVSTGLVPMIDDLQRALLATRTGVLLLLVQLVALAAYALLLTAGLMIEQRRVESAMLHARGAATGQLVTQALLEGVVLAVPAAAAAPWLAALALRLFNRMGPLADIGLTIDPQVSVASYVVAALGALLAVGALVAPAVRAARSLSAASRAKGRQGSRGMAQRVGLDLALVVAATVGLWQLRLYGGALTNSLRGGLGIDPLLVAAPAIGLIAGSILALRLIPLLAQAAEAIVSRRRSAVASLGAWQLARRPLRYSRSALLLTLTVALGGFATLYIATWTGSQRDQATRQVGADIRVQPDQRTGALPLTALAAAYHALPGVTGSMPVGRSTLSIFASGSSAELLALDAAAAPGIVAWRADEAAQPLATLMAPLAAARPTVDGPILPGSPVRVAVDVGVSLAPPPKLPPGRRPPAVPPSGALRLLVVDGTGSVQLLSMGDVALVDGTQRIERTIGGAGPDGAWFGLPAPVRLLSISIGIDAPRGDMQFNGTVTIRGIQSSGKDTEDAWSAAALGGNWLTAQPGSVTLGNLQLAPAGQGELAIAIDTGITGGPRRGAQYAIQQASLGPATAGAVPILANARFLAMVGIQVGGTLALDLGGGPEVVRISGVFADFPTTDSTMPIVVADLPTLQVQQAVNNRPQVPTEWWLATNAATDAATAAALRATPYSSTSVLDRVERTRALQTDPLALGVIGALTLGFVAAALFAAIGFAVSAAVSARERLTEFAVLRALGLSPGQLAGWLAVEHALLVVVSLAAGTGLGLLLGWLVLPFATMKREPGPVLPAPTLTIPWDGIAILETLVVVVLGVTVLILVVLLRRVGLGSALRLGED
jgi:ABC-type lipoprotein release transport system permease subunit